MQLLVEKIQSNQAKIYDWLKGHEESKELPLYSSVDIRDAGFKAAVVDTNIFPAGFNNLCEHGIEDAIKFMRQAVLERASACENILIVAEEHTRNTWYLENIRVLQEIIKKAGFHVVTATFLEVQPAFCESARYVELITATGQDVRIYCFKTILKEIQAGLKNFDLILLNNDLTTGIPDVLTEAKIPIYPSIQAGWHARQKSHHFKIANELIAEFAGIAAVDPWFFSCLDRYVDRVDINNESDRARLTDSASDLFAAVSAKHKEHGIDEKPYILVKSDSGTYGMGIVAVEDPKEILEFNRKARNKLHKGKSAQLIDKFLLQEGVPTIHNIDNKVSEVVIYQIANNFLGGFYRSHAEKTPREILNAQGMDFKKMCPHLPKYGDCCAHQDMTMFDIYRILARIAGIAAHREIVHLEAAKK